MKCLTIWQPWASYILGTLRWKGRPVKDVENRCWPPRYQGPMLVHAGKSRLDLDLAGEAAGKLPRGALIGVVDVVGCVRDYDSPWSVEGQYQWLLANPRVFVEPIPFTGRQGLFDVPESVFGHVRLVEASEISAMSEEAQ